MRDDLHKTVSLPSPWTRVLRHLSKDRWSPHELAPLIVTTVQDDLAARSDGWHALDDALSEGRMDLFDDREEKMRLNLLRIQDGPLSVGARMACEIALGILATDGMSSSFPVQVMRAVGRAHASDHIEQAASQIAARRGLSEASQVLAQFSKALALCDFSVRAVASVRRAEKSVGELLSTELDLRP